MYGIDGIQMITELKKDYPVIPPIIFVTGMHDHRLEKKVREHNVHAYLNKNVLDQTQMQESVRSAVVA